MTGKVVHVLSGQPYDVYVGRRNNRHGLSESLWANPFTLNPRKSNRDDVLAAYENYIKLIANDIPGAEGNVSALRGKTLACWCAPKDGHLTTDDETVCHAQILLQLAEEES